MQNRIDHYALKERDFRITACVLGLLSLFLFSTSFFLFGMGTLSPTALMGLGILPYLGGALLSFVALGILCGSFVFVILSLVRASQKEQWQGAWNRLKNVEQ